MYKKEFDNLYNMLEQTKLKKRSQKNGNNRRGFDDYYGGLYGMTKRRYRSGGKQLSLDSKNQPEVYDEIFRIGRLICKIPFSTVQLNKNLQCKLHRDNHNTGGLGSTLISFGDFEGGEIAIQRDENSTEFDIFSAKYQPIQFLGEKLTHYNLPHTGTKYSLVFFNC
jgi:hypothetical protein